MKVIRIRNPETLSPLHVVMIALVVATVAGSSLLLAAAESMTLIDGAREWQAESPLRAVVQLLCLNYEAAMINAGDIKVYLLGMGTALAMLAMSVAILGRPRSGEEEAIDAEETRDVDESDEASQREPGAAANVSAGSAEASTSTSAKRQIPPLMAAQMLVGLYLLWSFASCQWSAAPDLAVGAGVLLAIQFLWALSVGNGLSPAAGRWATRAIILISGVVAAVAIWYYYGRNPILRAKFPYGNPTFLSTCLIPGILLGVAWAAGQLREIARTLNARAIGVAVMALAMVTLCLGAFLLADSRGPMVGLAVGALAMVFFALTGWRKVLPALACVVLVVGGAMYFMSMKDAPSSTGRGSSARLRLYAWDYAFEMFNASPITGHGQGGFALAGDAHVAGDVLDDPSVFGARITHAHNEWLEVMADLGSTGLVLIVGIFLLTFRSGMLALRAQPPPKQRWALVGVMGALVGMIVAETFGVGLRVAGVSTIFYTLVGLVWALSSPGVRGLVTLASATSGRRLAFGTLAGLLGVGTLIATQQDFRVARRSYELRQQLANGNLEKAVELAELGGTRLSPQRALRNLFLRGDAYLRMGSLLQERATDRVRRAYQSDPPNRTLLERAGEDYQDCEAHCEAASRTLKELIERSPAYLDHGRLEFVLNITRARSANARNDAKAREQYAISAVAALERELKRQPFDSYLAAQYAMLADPSVSLGARMNVLARPLRYRRISTPYVEFLSAVLSRPGFETEFEPIVKAALKVSTAGSPLNEQGEPVETWAPEILRISATIHYLTGSYREATDALSVAAALYEKLTDQNPFGAATCYAELAHCTFYNSPNDQYAALQAAKRAIELAPDSRLGRELKASVEVRMVDYYLSAGREPEALELLKRTAPRAPSDEDLQRELGARYRQLCESLLQRREALLLTRSATDLLPQLRGWIARAIELNEGDAAAHYRAADFAFHAGEDQATADHLLHALERGLPTSEVARFLTIAREERPNSAPLEAIWNMLPQAEGGDVLESATPTERGDVPATAAPVDRGDQPVSKTPATDEDPQSAP